MAKDEKKEKETKEEEIIENQPGNKKKPFVKIIIIILLFIVIGSGIFVGVYYFTPFLGGQKAAKTTARPLMGALWSLEPFIVNLADNQGERYLKVIIQMEVSDNSLVTELDQLKPKLRDTILDLLTVKSYSDLMEMGGKQRLRDEIITRLNSFLTKGKIVRVYFSDFVVQ